MPVSKSDVKHSIYALAFQNKVTSTFYSLLMPILAGVFATYYTDLTKVHPALFWLPAITFIGLAFVAAMVTWDVKLAPEVYLELEEACDKNTALEDRIDLLALVQEQAIIWSVMVRGYIKRGTNTPDELDEAIREICGVIVENRDGFFHFKRNELWNFAVYLYDRERDTLVPVWRERHLLHPSVGPGRFWAPGKGHVGLAFVDGAAKITPDATDPGVWSLMNTPATAKPHDEGAYASFISQPIGPVAEGNRPFGVLVATSNVVGRFDRGNALALRHAASAIATLMHLAYSEETVLGLVRKQPAER